MTDPGDAMRAKRRGSVTLKDVAREAGVGIMTVSRAINSPDAVSEKLRTRVESAVVALGYVPNRWAGTLASARSRLVTVIVPSLSSRVFGEIVSAADAVLTPHGYQIMVSNTAFSLDDEETVCRKVLGWRPEGIIISGIDHNPATREMLMQSGIPVVEALELGSDPIDINIGISHADAGATAAEHLLSRGRRRIAFIGAEMDLDFRAQRRRAGFCEALARHGVTPALEIHHSGRVGFATGARAMEELLASGEAVDAVFCVNDELAVGAVGAAIRNGRAVPDDLAIIGFSDLDVSAEIVPSLTTIRLPRVEMGRLAAEAVLAGRRETGEKRIDVGYELVVRESS
ncbi:LacI family DNA-binding transcriptional regulator [Acuticoccus sp. M5D2P5]|uniref:LacI family DNA-binding transcriptional regulator n=1 Tax=Acuticoccus kalidii TaxID=2910977 RepID=UPI001F46233E|nr:LacI family DNA-binding transcriptional regulator [Acuticoccus kalidii]MCF3932351.1 LacI family DNA-binding transcriptional regulator [Acuticoccus kalidii]